MTSSSSPVACVQFRTEQLTLSDGIPLGSGALSHVVQCRITTTTVPALPVVVKIVSKLQVLQQGKVQSIMNEKAALQRLGPHPFVARLFGTSQSEDELYYVLEWLPHGDLLQHIRRAHMSRVRTYQATSVPAGEDRTSSTAAAAAGIPVSSSALRCLDFHDVQLITAQLIVALSRASAVGVVLRDLKPENVAFDEKYRACLLDFDTVDLDGAAVVPETNKGVACPPPRENTAATVVSDCNSSSAEAEEEEEEEDEQQGKNMKPSSLATAAPPAASAASSPSAAPTTTTTTNTRRRLTVSEIQGMRAKSASFCGTAQYVSPEMVGECKWSFSSDLWALGALVYEMTYGVHLFAGMAQFEVLAKVIQGDYLQRADLFPYINFNSSTTSEVDGAVNVEGTDQDKFAVLRDFILCLLHMDPTKRLGVHPVTHRFDETSLRRHALFAGFSWDSIDAQLRTFQARTFQASSSSPVKPSTSAHFGPSRSAFDKAAETQQDSESDADLPDEVKAAAASAAAAVALADLEAASVDPSPSLASLYHTLPFNDPSYAEYVYRATADANPFEKFFVDATTRKSGAGAGDVAATTSKTVKGAATTAASPTAVKAYRPSSSTASVSAAAATARVAEEAAVLGVAVPADAYGAVEVSKEADDEDDDVIDDVGMCYGGTGAHPDFHA